MEKKENITDDEIIQLQTIKKAERSKYIQDKIRLQNEEISKTNNLIIKFQEILADQKNMLFKLTEELKTVLTDDEINKLNYVDHDGIENMIEDSPKLQDTDLRIIQPHTTENENRKRKMPQELIINEIEDEISDISSLDSWSSHSEMVDRHHQISHLMKELEKVKRRLDHVRKQNTDLQSQLQKMETKVLKYRQVAREKETQLVSTQLQLKSERQAAHANIKEMNNQLMISVPTTVYSSLYRKYEEVRQAHEICLQRKILEDHCTIQRACVPLMQEALSSLGPPDKSTKTDPSSTSIKPQSSANRSRRVRRANAAAIRREMKAQGWRYLPPTKKSAAPSVDLVAIPTIDPIIFPN